MMLGPHVPFHSNVGNVLQACSDGVVKLRKTTKKHPRATRLQNINKLRFAQAVLWEIKSMV